MGTPGSPLMHSHSLSLAAVTSGVEATVGSQNTS
jgi:hypothetical protein